MPEEICTDLRENHVYKANYSKSVKQEIKLPKPKLPSLYKASWSENKCLNLTSSNPHNTHLLILRELQTKIVL